ncbi:MAG: adenylate kinase family protein [Euryarchaeota archaeon]|jgi:adenylate kinase|uniref:adenylate kinase family protein n=1 Tax=Methanobacterium sp. MZD130B TaxID=3394378 RepID=UPI0017603C54|nr:adenylate kinase family protein [Euryarchaeota archaeon]HHT19559.1 AAA family ATPase [Methanobacterium sp.]
MIILITGTPGTGKTTIAPLLGKTLKCPVIDVNQLVDEKHLYTGVDPEKGYKIVDMDALTRELHGIIINRKESHGQKDKNLQDQSCILIEGHLSHNFPLADYVVVLRTEPKILRDRLQKRNWKDSKIRENLQAEALDICTWEAYQTHGSKVHEVNTSYITPEEVINIIMEILSGKKSLPPGNIDFSDYLK